MQAQSIPDYAIRLNTFIRERRLVRKAWTGTTPDGRETACLLAALAPETGETKRASTCPAEIMPAWFAELVPWFDDKGSGKAWPRMVARFAGLAARWHVLTPEAWRRLDYACRAVAVGEAMQHTGTAAALAVCNGVLALLDRAATGSVVSPEEWKAAARAAWVMTTWAGGHMVAAATEATATAARQVAEAAVAAAEAGAGAEAEAAADHMTAAMFELLEAAIVAAEG